MTATTIPPRTSRRLALAAALALGLAACGGGDDADDAAADDTASAATEESDSAEETADETTEDAAEDASAETTDDTTDGEETAGDESSTDAAAGAPVTTAESDFGTILVTADGFTVYGFTQDQQGESSACTGDCLQAWPPVTLEDETVPEGLDAEVFGVIVREDDGSAQLTANGWPLYTYSPDAAPGDTNGQGVGDVWWVVAPDGTLIMEAPAEEEAADLGY